MVHIEFSLIKFKEKEFMFNFLEENRTKIYLFNKISLRNVLKSYHEKYATRLLNMKSQVYSVILIRFLTDPDPFPNLLQGYVYEYGFFFFKRAPYGYGYGCRWATLYS